MRYQVKQCSLFIGHLKVITAFKTFGWSRHIKEVTFVLQIIVSTI